MLNSSHIKKQDALNLPSRLHMHFSQPQCTIVSHNKMILFFFNPSLHFLFQDKTHNLRLCSSPTHDFERTGLTSRKPIRTNQCVCLGGGFAFSFHQAALGRIKIQLLFVFWEPVVSTAVKATSFIAFLKTISARQTVGQEEKENFICHAGLHFWSWEEPESSSTGSSADIPTYLRRWQRHSWHGTKHHS